MGLVVLDSDAFFHKLTDPPFQEQYTPEERRMRLGAALVQESSWVLSGSVATWDLDVMEPTHGVLLKAPAELRMRRLLERQRCQFGPRIERAGDMEEEHEAFMRWAAGYEDCEGAGRNLVTDAAFLEARCPRCLVVAEDEPLDGVVGRILAFLRP